MFASKTALQHVSKPNVLMNARLQRLGRYYEGKPVLVWCYPLQELPNGIRVDGDGDWAPTTELLRRSTSGGAVRYGLHTWDCYSVTQATIALSSAESEFYATGCATASQLLVVHGLDIMGRVRVFGSVPDAICPKADAGFD